MQGFFHFLWKADPHLEAELRDLVLIGKSIRGIFILVAEASVPLLSKVSRIVHCLLNGILKVFNAARVVIFVQGNVDEKVPSGLLVHACICGKGWCGSHTPECLSRADSALEYDWKLAFGCAFGQFHAISILLSTHYGRLVCHSETSSFCP